MAITLRELTVNEAGRGWTHEISFTHEDFTSTSDATKETKDVTITGRLKDVGLYVTESFEGGDVTDTDIAVGTTADDDLYIDETDSFGATAVAINSGTGLNTAKEVTTYDSGASLRIALTPATGNNAELTQGKAVVRLNLVSTDVASV
jgi:hypothetical protein